MSIYLCTQQLNDVLKSPMRDVIMDQCKTKIFLPNPSILTNEITAATYAEFGLNPKQIYMIGNGTPAREYYITNPIGNRLFNLKLNTVALTFLGKTGMGDVELAKQVKAKYKDHFGYHWLKQFNQTNAAEYWLQTYNLMREQNAKKEK